MFSFASSCRSSLSSGSGCLSAVGPSLWLWFAVVCSIGFFPIGSTAGELIPELEAEATSFDDILQASDPFAESKYAIGFAFIRPADFEDTERSLVPRVLVGYRYGRLRLSSSGGGSIIGFGTEPVEGGVSASILDKGRLTGRLGLRLGRGRDIDEARVREVVGDVGVSVLGRGALRYQINPLWSAEAVVVTDLLRRGNGTRMTLGLSRTEWVNADTRVGFGGSVSFGDRTHMRGSFSSVSDDDTLYLPGGGPKEASVGFGLTRKLTQRWIVFGSTGIAWRLGPARDSPDTKRHWGVSATIGIAYRCCGNFGPRRRHFQSDSPDGSAP